jgi:hypothetical protein
VIDLLRGVLFWTIRPAWRVALRVIRVRDPWERLEYRVPIRKYGAGALHEFEWYFEGSSAVDVKSLDELCDWLIGCEYVRDPELFREEDFWQHPLTFEKLRKGDCEDHALWAWRKLVELGFDADLVTGRCLPWNPHDKSDHRSHAWVVFRAEGEVYLLESVAKSPGQIVRPLGEANLEYRPEFGVDRNRQRFTFNGVLLTMRDREFGVRTDT